MRKLGIVWPWRCPSCSTWRMTSSCRPCQQRIAMAAFERLAEDVAKDIRRMVVEGTGTSISADAFARYIGKRGPN